MYENYRQTHSLFKLVGNIFQLISLQIVNNSIALDHIKNTRINGQNTETYETHIINQQKDITFGDVLDIFALIKHCHHHFLMELHVKIKDEYAKNQEILYGQDECLENEFFVR